MKTYVVLKDGRTMVLWSDNEDEKTMQVYPLEKQHTFDVEVDSCETVQYADVETISIPRAQATSNATA